MPSVEISVGFSAHVTPGQYKALVYLAEQQPGKTPEDIAANISKAAFYKAVEKLRLDLRRAEKEYDKGAGR